MRTGEKFILFVIIAIPVLAVLGVGYWFFFGSNAAARRFGGTQVVKLDKGKKFVNATWKDDSIWIVTRTTKTGEPTESYEFIERSNLGVLQGKVVIQEQE